MTMVAWSRIASILAVLLVVEGCDLHLSSPHWTEQEKSELVHFTASLYENSEARKILFKGPEPTAVEKGSFTPAEYRQILGHLRASCTHSKLVSDVVLDKLHPELKGHFRGEFQKGIEFELYGIGVADLRRQMDGQLLMDNWIVWISPHAKDFNRIIRQAHQQK